MRSRPLRCRLTWHRTRDSEGRWNGWYGHSQMLNPGSAIPMKLADSAETNHADRMPRVDVRTKDAAL